MQSLLYEKYKDNDLTQIVGFLRDKADYDADKQKPMPGPYSKERGDGTHLRRLEDIDESWVRKYLENVLYGIRIDKRGGLREHRENNQEARVLLGADGEQTDESDLLLEEYNFAPLDIARAKAKLPYLLKRLFDKSCQLRVSVMSLIIAYERVKANGAKPGPKALLEQGVHRMSPDGHILDLFPASANSGKLFPVASDWVRGYSRDRYFQDYMELLRACNVLGVNLCDENPFDYQVENISALQVTYIAGNREYLRGSRPRNLTVLDSIGHVRVADYAMGESVEPVNAGLLNTIQAVLDNNSQKVKDILSMPEDRVWLNKLFKLYASTHTDFRIPFKCRVEATGLRIPSSDPSKTVIPIAHDFVVKEGFLYHPLDLAIPQAFDVKSYFGAEGAFAGAHVYAVAHISGHLFTADEAGNLYCVSAETLLDYMEDYSEYRKVGRWESC